MVCVKIMCDFEIMGEGMVVLFIYLDLIWIDMFGVM